MRIAVPLAAVIVLAAAITAGILLFREPGLDHAIDDFESGDYIDAIETLNGLIPRANYDSLEKMYYYRARAINRLADELDHDYSRDLGNASMEKKGTREYERSLEKIEKALARANEKTGGDLAIRIARERSRIISRGNFYDEFTAKFRGSPLIEDLDFEETQKSVKASPEDATQTLLAFYRRYPQTAYMAHIVRHLLDAISADVTITRDNGDAMLALFIAYGNRFPTSPELSRLFTVAGDNVNLRNSPGTEGQIVGRAGQDEIVIQLEKSMDTMQIGDVRDYWYRIASFSGARGWIFGKFLKRLDMTRHNEAGTHETWTLEERFAQWNDSNTPAGWSHVNESAKDSLSFYDSGQSKIVRLSGAKGRHAGLFSRYSTARAFTIECRARNCGGTTTAFACVLPDGRVFALDLAAML
jgi:hypothetical protein